MDNLNRLCKGCMQFTAENGVCHACGFNEHTHNPLPHHLKPDTILGGKYILGRKIGEGGFGITYMGLDLNLNMRVAIKEYFPSGCVTRNTDVSNTITVFDGEPLKMFEHGREKFIEEARTIAQFQDSDGIVSVKDFFLENGTAYIVMEYLDGENLKDFLAKRGGKISVDEALKMVRPILSSLYQLHKNGLIHRDISPDNIMITKKGKVKLIDFGAARDVNINKSLSIQLKPGYAPEEQYRTHGKQGAWTDVYALCATIYRMITGIVPEESNERLIEDHLKTPSSMGINIHPQTEQLLMQGLAVRYTERVQNIETLYNAFYKGASAPASRGFSQPPQPVSINNTPQKSKWFAISLILAGCAVPLLLVVVIFATISVYNANNTPDPTIEPISTVIPATEPPATPAPTPVPLPPRQDLYNASYTYKRMSEIHSSYLASDEEFYELRETILDFNYKCTDYINNGNMSVFMYLRPDTTAYNQQTKYKKDHPTLREVLHNVDVINARYDGRWYYLWVAENKTVTENGTSKTKTDHWVYKLERTNTGFVILDYTYDPAFT